MKSILICLLPSIMLFSCYEKYDPDNFHFSNEKQETLLKIVTFVAPVPNGATAQARLDSTHRKYYMSMMKDFSFERFYINSDGVRFFYVLRPARSTVATHRGVGGMYQVADDGRIVGFKEVFNTPVAPTEDLTKKGAELFAWMVKHGNVEPYQKNTDYIEWPNQFSTYDTARHEWVAK
jgi:hypothetical protein